jgi:hypothetical protein
MKSKFYLILAFIVAFSFASRMAKSQFSQTVKGVVLDQASQGSLPGASVVILNSDPVMGDVSNDQGAFKIESVPVGRHNIQVSFIGYETLVLPAVLVTSGKEVVLTIELKEKLNEMSEIVVKGGERDRPINQMTTLSGFTMSAEETRRFAGGLDDPGRLASVYAGVADGTIESNGIIVRGNAPTGTIYRVEGIEVNNPNHFFGEDMLGGGFVSIINNHTLGSSDFLTGAFAAEYGNALSAVFDLNLRTGNTETREHAFQAGVMGLDVASEGPFIKGKKASYLFNYRYSTFGLIQDLLPENQGLPVYQDLTFKLNFPTKAGIFTVWGSGGLDDYKFGEIKSYDSFSKKEVINDQSSTGFVGLKHKLILNSTTFLSTSILANASTKKNRLIELGQDLNFHPTQQLDYVDGRYVFSTFINKKFGKRLTNKTGFNFINLFYDIDNQVAPVISEPLEQITIHNGNCNLMQFYSQSRINIGSKLAANLGVHAQYFALNEEFSVEPRIGLQYTINNRNALSFAYGLHSQTQLINTYFVQNEINGEIFQPNKELGFTKSHHFVLAYDFRINDKTRIKIEPFYQYLFGIPVVEGSSFSMINLDDINTFNESLINDGTATNIGVDITLERFFYNGFYYLATASLFDSKYVGGDKIERNTRYNKNFVGNILGGKEWEVGNKNLLGVNVRLYLNGGDRANPVDHALSATEGDVVYDYTKAFSDKNPFSYRCDLSFTFRRNHKNYSTTWALQVLNVSNSVTIYGKNFNSETNSVESFEERGMLPNISWKIEF